MPRVTAEDVLAIKPTMLAPIPFIQTASRLVDYYCLPMGLPADLLYEVELYWAAHLVSLADPQVHQQRMGDTAQTFATANLGTGFEASPYGQMVVQMVPDLATATSLKTAAFDVF
ncbi:MAG TPA: hypothetical protein VF077_12640 [Nitrospiraceae bacterium]